MKQVAKSRILSVDDDVDVSQLIEMVLSQDGYEVSSFHQGSVALAALEAGEVRPDLILLDLDMPEMNGYEICERLQKEPDWAIIPVVFLTGSSTQANRLRAFQLGAVGFLSKPVDAAVLSQEMARFLKVGQQWRMSFTPLLKDEPPGAGTAPAKNEAMDEAKDPTDLAKAPANDTAKDPARDSAGKKSAPPVPSQLPALRTGFTGFRAYLAEQTRRPTESLASPEDLYPHAERLGLSQAQMARLIAAYSRLDYLETLEADQVRLGVLPAPYCRRYQLVPIRDGEQTAFVMSNPFLLEIEDTLQRLGASKRLIAEPSKVQSLLSGKGLGQQDSAPISELNQVVDEVQSRYQPAPSLDEDELETGDENAAPLIRLVNRLIEQAYQMRASDIHIEPAETSVVVRYRVDGDLRVVSRLQPASLIQTLAARIKVMAGLNIAERRLPQDGRIVFKEHGSRQLDVDLRVATSPMNFGEKIVMRLIDKQKTTLPLEALGFSERNLVRYRQQIRNPYGMVLHVGPTGSGKSMTLYAALNEISRPEINIQTAEDPIEYTLPDINQLQVKPEIGLTFARALRSYLRQDPDVILVGEIRDRETADVALEAALTGHLLLSTLHTNDAAATLTRFVEMGIEPFMVSASVLMICAQRLVRRLCEQCRVPVAASPEQKLLLGWPAQRELTLYHAPGCSHCDGSGYRGRLGVHELLIPTDPLRQALGQHGLSAEALKKQAVAEGMTTLFWDGVDKVLQGLTSLEEVCAKVRVDEFDSAPDWWRQERGDPGGRATSAAQADRPAGSPGDDPPAAPGRPAPQTAQSHSQHQSQTMSKAQPSSPGGPGQLGRAAAADALPEGQRPNQLKAP